MSKLTELYGNVIDVYSREEAIDDGVLEDVSEIARQAGFKYPVAITSALSGLLSSIPEGYAYQSKNGRLWDVLSMAYFAIKADRTRKNTIFYPLQLPNLQEKTIVVCGRHVKKKVMVLNVRLKMVLVPNGKGEPCITIMLPTED